MSNGLAGENVDAEPSLVEVLDEDGATSQSSDQLDVAVVQKIILLAGEARMGLLLNLEDYITGLDSRRLVTLTTELNLGAAADTLVDVDVEDLAIDDGLLAVALLAAVLLLDDLTLAVAVRADGLESLDHGAHLAHHGFHTMAVTARALLNCTFLATETLALGADDRPLQSQLRDLAAVDILKGDLVSVVNGSGLGRTALVHATEHAAKATAEAAATTTEELSEEVLGGHATTAAGAALKASLAILVVNLSLLGI